jgi:hypothetical protein
MKDISIMPLCVLLLALVSIISTGCSKSAPKCNDENVLKLVYQVAHERYVDDKDYKHMFSMKDIVNGGINKETGAGSCSGELLHKITANNSNAVDTLTALRLKKLDDVSFVVPLNIKYITNVTTEGKYHVRVNNLEGY